MLPTGNVFALPPAGDNSADNLYTWRGNVWWSATQNGSVRIDAAIMTSCGLLLEAVPLAFKLDAPPPQGCRTRDVISLDRYGTATNSWGTATRIGTGMQPQIVADSTGNGLAVWNLYNGTGSVWANRYSAATNTWNLAAISLIAGAGSGGSAQVAFDSMGNAIALWAEQTGTRFNIWANRYTTGTGWGTAALIESDDTGNAADPQIAVDAAGNASVVWYQSDGLRYNIWSNRCIAGSGWGSAALLEALNVGDALRPQIAIDANGNGVAVWDQHDGSRISICASSYR